MRLLMHYVFLGVVFWDLVQAWTNLSLTRLARTRTCHNHQQLHRVSPKYRHHHHHHDRILLSSLSSSSFSTLTDGKRENDRGDFDSDNDYDNDNDDLIIPGMPKVSPASGVKNQVWIWKRHTIHEQHPPQSSGNVVVDVDVVPTTTTTTTTATTTVKIRYQQAGPINGPPVLLIHGLFVNADHWRYTLRDLAQAGYCVYAMDLLGCGYSDKPAANSIIATMWNGEQGRFVVDKNDKMESIDDHGGSGFVKSQSPPVVEQISLGMTCGTKTRLVDVDLKHPLGSVYNFFTWSEQITDFCRQVVLPQSIAAKKQSSIDTDTIENGLHPPPQVTLVSNSIGTISALQSVLDTPDIYNGVFVVCPNFRELHSAEVPFRDITMPIIRTVQSLLRRYGQVVFDALANPKTVKQILQEPYARTEAIDDVLVQVLLDPLLTPGASNVVFDILSYSAGPLPEQQLALFPPNGIKPVWICYGRADPWTPGPRVDALQKLFPDTVEKVVAWDGVGHCPHDEAPDLVLNMLLEFLQQRLQQHPSTATSMSSSLLSSLPLSSSPS